MSASPTDEEIEALLDEIEREELAREEDEDPEQPDGSDGRALQVALGVAAIAIAAHYRNRRR